METELTGWTELNLGIRFIRCLCARQEVVRLRGAPDRKAVIWFRYVKDLKWGLVEGAERRRRPSEMKMSHFDL